MGMGAAELAIILAMFSGNLAPEPMRSFLTTGMRMGVTSGALIFMGSAQAPPPPSMVAPAAPMVAPPTPKK